MPSAQPAALRSGRQRNRIAAQDEHGRPDHCRVDGVHHPVGSDQYPSVGGGPNRTEEPDSTIDHPVGDDGLFGPVVPPPQEAPRLAPEHRSGDHRRQ